MLNFETWMKEELAGSVGRIRQPTVVWRRHEKNV